MLASTNQKVVKPRGRVEGNVAIPPLSSETGKSDYLPHTAAKALAGYTLCQPNSSWGWGMDLVGQGDFDERWNSLVPVDIKVPVNLGKLVKVKE